jgi:hypothetical protein
MTWCSLDNESRQGAVRKTLVAGAIAVVAVFAGVIYFARDPEQQAPAASQPPAGEGARAEAVKPAAEAPLPATRSDTPRRPVTSDPRLAALMVSPDNGLIEFATDDNGKVFKEIDNDPNSPGYRRPLREYSYAGDQVVRLVSYRYLGDEVQIVQADVTYKPDGTVDEYRESTSHVFGKDARGGD